MNAMERYSALMRKPTKLTPAESDEALELAGELGRDAESDRAGCRRVGMLLDRFNRVEPPQGDDLLERWKAAEQLAYELKGQLAAREGAAHLASKTKLDLRESVEAVAEIFEGDTMSLTAPAWFISHVQSAAHQARHDRQQAERAAKVILR